MPKFIEEYLYALKPVVDEQALTKATGNIESWLKSKSKNFDNYLSAKKIFKETEKEIKRLEKAGISSDIIDLKKKELKYDEKKDKLDALQKSLTGTDIAFGTFSKSLNIATGTVGFFSTGLNLAFENIEKLSDKASDMSNKFISGSSIFVDKDTRNIMAKFGVNTTQAQGISASMEALGISSSDFGRLTSGQIQAYNRLMAVYQEGIDSIDVDKLERFNQTTQEYQLKRAEFDLKIQTSLMKIFSESETLPKMFDTFGDFLDTISDILGSPIIQFGFDAISSLLTNILDFLNGIGKIFSFIPGFGSQKTTNITINSKVDASGNPNYNANDTANEIYQEFSNQYGLGA